MTSQWKLRVMDGGNLTHKEDRRDMVDIKYVPCNVCLKCKGATCKWYEFSFICNGLAESGFFRNFCKAVWGVD